MILKNIYNPDREWEVGDTEQLISGLLPHEEEYKTFALAGIVARMLDAMKISDQQRLDIIYPYSGWEVKEAK